jgi:sugar phosphate isomerase/epimerase
MGIPLGDAELKRIAGLGISGLELAPLTQWSDWKEANVAQAIYFREAAARHGLRIAAMQGIVFRATTIGWVEHGAGAAMATHFERIAELAKAMDAKVAVLGAPLLRKLHGLAPESAKARAAEALRQAVRPFEVRGLTLGIEPVPEALGCELGCNARDCAELVRMVHSPALRLHLDCAALRESGEDLESGWQEWGELVCHVHLSEPGLGALRGGLVPHTRNIAVLKTMGYQGWVSVEMLRPSGLLEEAVDWPELCTAVNDSAQTS